ncbi:MAG: polysaccharide deacetylase family protein [Proteobacteria bacterium]|nr:polysaccharide deacetylase family protein [Pseudomonadota bacterium]
MYHLNDENLGRYVSLNTFKKRLFRHLNILYRTAASLLSPFFQKDGVILMFHRVLQKDQKSTYLGLMGLEVTQEIYVQTIHYFRNRCFVFLSFADFAARYRQKSLPKKFVVVTFDDGYVDNATFVGPFMAKEQLPWTLFLNSGFCDGTLPCWWYGLGALLDVRDSVNTRGLTPDSTLKTFELRSIQDRNSTYLELREIIHGLWAREEQRKKVVAWFHQNNIDLFKITSKVATGEWM